MAHCEAERDGVYRIDGKVGLFGTRLQVLPDAVMPLPDGPASTSSFGWIRDSSITPSAGDLYLVEFISENKFRIWGYVDCYGRAFVTDRPLFAPPARDPDILFSRPWDGKSPTDFGTLVTPRSKFKRDEEIRGTVQLRDKRGVRQVSRFSLKNGRYSLFDSWCDFGAHSSDLTYYEVLARCFFAFTFRPLLGGARVPARGLSEIMASLDSETPFDDLLDALRDIRSAALDSAMRPPALALLLASWLDDANAMGVLASAQTDELNAPSLRFVRAKRYSDTYFIGRGEGGEGIPEETIWAIESAINRFVLIARKLEDDLGDVRRDGTDGEFSEIDACGAVEAQLFEVVATQAPDPAHPADENAAAPNRAGEWDVRRLIGESIERFQLPVRFAVEYRVDVCAGAVAFDAVVPSAQLMPQRMFSLQAGTWNDLADDERERMALRYAEHVGMMLAAAAFHAGCSIEKVVVCARELATVGGAASGDDAPDGAGGGVGCDMSDDGLGDASDDALDSGASDEGDEFEGGSIFVELEDGSVVVEPGGNGSGSAGGCSRDAHALYQVTFSRSICEGARFRDALESDPASLFAECGARFGKDADEFSLDDAISADAQRIRGELPEVGALAFGPREAKAFGAESLRDLRIHADAQLRNAGERLADAIARATSTTEAIRLAQAEQNAADDPRVFEACTRLMTDLLEGKLDPHDQNALVSCFIGEDPYLNALRQARAVAQTDPHKAASILRDTIRQTEESKRFADNSEAVHRMFDSYASRIIYNRERQGSAPWRSGLAFPHPDEGKRVELLPSSLAMCYLESVRLLEESFNHAEEAVQFGLRCIQVAPTYTPAYRQTARAYMLMGDMSTSSRMLRRCLEIATQPDEIALAYYQLAYVEWKAGKAALGMACYMKSMLVAPVYLAQCTIEMHRLVAETGQSPIDREEVDVILAGEGVPIAPLDSLLDALDDAMRTAIDDNIFQVGQPLLALRLFYRPDDALVNVHKSLNAPLPPQALD